MSGLADVSRVLSDGLLDDGLFHGFEIVVFEYQGIVRGQGWRLREQKVVRRDGFVLLHNDRSFDGVLKFAHISRPGVVEESPGGFIADCLAGPVVFT